MVEGFAGVKSHQPKLVAKMAVRVGVQAKAATAMEEELRSQNSDQGWGDKLTSRSLKENRTPKFIMGRFLSQKLVEKKQGLMMAKEHSKITNSKCSIFVVTAQNDDWWTMSGH